MVGSGVEATMLEQQEKFQQKRLEDISRELSTFERHSSPLQVTGSSASSTIILQRRVIPEGILYFYSNRI